MRMSDPARIKGWWFLPDSPDHRVPGILTWSQDEGVNLEVIGGVKKLAATPGLGDENRFEAGFIGSNPRAITIFGETDAGKPLSLWDTERHKHTKDAFGTVREEFWHGSWVCVGAHILSATDAELCDPVVALDNLYYLTDDGRFCPPQWTRIEGVENPGERQPDGTHLFPYSLPVVGGLKANVAEGSTSTTTYHVETHATRPWISQATEAYPALKLDFMTRRARSGPSIQLSVGARVRMEHSSGSWSAQDILAAVHPLSALMRLATFADNGVEYLSARTANGREVSLLCRLGHESAPDVAFEVGSLAFTFADIDLATFMSAWDRLTQGPQAAYAWNVVTGVIGHAPKLVEEAVGQVVAAAEGFHTWCLGERKRRWPLRDRLVSLHGRLDEKVSAVLGLDVDRWADWAAWARNHVDHAGITKHHELGDIFRLKTIADTVLLVVYLAVLRELSMPAKRVIEALGEHPRLRVLVEKCQSIKDLPDIGAPRAD